MLSLTRVRTISTFYILNHSHTDIGFTDHQDLVFRQHGEFIDQAVQLCEQTANYPPEAQYRWTCEVTGMTERYLESAAFSSSSPRIPCGSTTGRRTLRFRTSCAGGTRRDSLRT